MGLRGDGVKLACVSGFEKWSDLGRAELSAWCGAVLTRWLLFWVSSRACDLARGRPRDQQDRFQDVKCAQSCSLCH